MTPALNNETPQRHPWLANLEASPETAVSDFLAGYANVFPLTRADAPDAACMLVGQLDAGDPALEAFEEGMISWLNTTRMESLPTDSARLQDRIRQISEAFEIISLLKLRKAALMLRQQYIRWFEWVGRLVLAPSRDARASYCRMLANTQIIVAKDVSDPDSLSAFWLRVCKDAGSVYPKSYLQIGLLGLRRLPDSIGRGDSPWIAGLAAWAQTNDPSDKDFLRAWLPIKRLHPASP